MSKIARPGYEGNMRLLKAYGGGSSPPRQSYATGGAVNPALDEGLAAASDVGADKPSKGKDKGKKESKINVNVIIAGKDKDAAPPMPPPTGAAGLAPPPPMPMPPMAPPMGMPPGGPTGGPPMPMRAKGGRVPAAFAKNVAEPKATNDKGKAAKKSPLDPSAPMVMSKGGNGKPFATGGPVKAPTESGMLAEKGMQGGGGGAIGRLEKAKKYGK